MAGAGSSVNISTGKPVTVETTAKGSNKDDAAGNSQKWQTGVRSISTGNPLHGNRTKFRILKVGIRSTILIWRQQEDTIFMDNHASSSR